MLTILHTESSTGWGGQENRILKECIGLKKLGIRVIIACQPDSVLSKIAAKNSIEIEHLKIKTSFTPSAIARLLNIIKHEKVNVICTHSGKDSMVGAIAGRLSSVKPAIVRMRHLALPITSKITYSLLPHRIITVSEYVRDYLVNKEGIQANKVISIPTGIDLEKFNPDTVQAVSKKTLGLSHDSAIVGTIAILRRKKGHHTLLDAIPLVLKEFPRTNFLFVGDGPQRQNIEKRIEELGIADNVKLLGLRNDVPELLKIIDLFVLPTFEEALGTSFLEAMAMRKPVIGTRVGGIPEIVKDGISGILVEPENPIGLAAAIINLLNDKKQMEKIGNTGRKIVEENYSTEVMVNRTYTFYKSLVKELAI